MLNRFIAGISLLIFGRGDDCSIDCAFDSGTLRAIRIFNSVRIIRLALRSEISKSPLRRLIESARNREVVQ